MAKSNTLLRQENSPADAARLDRRIASVIAAVTLGLLLRNVVRDLLPGDAGEFHFAAWNWGVAHPTGYPLYLLAGGLWQRVWSIFGISPAFSLNALSAVFMAGAAALLYLLLRKWLPDPPHVARLAAGLAVAFLVANPTVRTQSVQAEVYSLHLLFLIAMLLAATGLARRQPGSTPVRPLVTLALLTGLSLSHHATTVLLLPPLALYLFLANRNWWQPWRAWLWAVPAFLLPLLLYLYIPLRSGPDASPWYHQPLGEGVLTLYSGGWQAFADFVSGRSISVGYYSPGAAFANIPTAALLWLRHYEWPGLLLIVLGLVFLVRLRNWSLLGLTLSYFAIQQLFNLFYAIGDIFVYYVPLYLVASIWIAFGAAGIGTAFGGAGAATAMRELPANAAPASPPARQALSTILLVILFWLPLQLWTRYSPLVEQLAVESVAARGMWEQIIAANPSAGAILISNDRNEIVPLFYLQTVEQRAQGHTGLFPLIAPDARFADVGATIQTALDAGAAASPGEAVYLIKPMPGLDARFALTSATPPLVGVTGPAAAAPAVVAAADYGPLHLLGYDLDASTAPTTTITLHWQVVAPLAADYTTTVQVFDAAGSKLAQDDRRAGGDYYPTTLWKPGEVILDRHVLVLPPAAAPSRLLVGLYTGPDAVLLAPALEIPIP